MNNRYIYQNELDKAYFQYDIPYENFKDLPGRTVSDKLLRDKGFDIAKIPEYDGHQRGPAAMVYKFLLKN